MDYLLIASFVGTIAFAFSGVLIGIKHNLDFIGVFILSILTANGGGVLRDLLLDRTPVILTDSSPFYVVIAIMAIVKLLNLKDRADLEQRWLFIISDAVGLVAFAVGGSLIAMNYELSIFGIIVLSFLTAVGGGIVRDVLVNEVPAIMQTGFYGSVAILVAILMISLRKAEISNDIATPATFISCLVIRLMAYKYRWKIKKF
jgi:uncharacterized membrane protein YeiH